jgi:hypothetical protein
MLLEQHRGAVDHSLMRQLLAEPGEAPTVPSPDAGGGLGGGPSGVVGLIAQAGPADVPPLAWCSFGPAGFGLYFPLPVTAEPPPAFRPAPDADGCDLWRRMTRDWLDRPLTGEARTALAALQGRFDHMAGEFRSEAAALRRRGDADGLARLAGSFTQNNWERFEEAWEAVLSNEAAWETACRMDAV